MDQLRVEHEAALAAAKADSQIAVEKAQQVADLSVKEAERENKLAIETVKAEANVRVAEVREKYKLLIHREELTFKYDDLGVKRVEAGLPEEDPDQPELPFPPEGDLPFPPDVDAPVADGPSDGDDVDGGGRTEGSNDGGEGE